MSFFLWGNRLQESHQTQAPKGCVSSTKECSLEVQRRGVLGEGRKGSKDEQRWSVYFNIKLGMDLWPPTLQRRKDFLRALPFKVGASAAMFILVFLFLSHALWSEGTSLRSPAAILIISRNACSDSTASSRVLVFLGVSHTSIARCVAKWGIAQMCLSTKGGYRTNLRESADLPEKVWSNMGYCSDNIPISRKTPRL